MLDLFLLLIYIPLIILIIAFFVNRIQHVVIKMIWYTAEFQRISTTEPTSAANGWQNLHYVTLPRCYYAIHVSYRDRTYKVNMIFLFQYTRHFLNNLVTLIPNMKTIFLCYVRIFCKLRFDFGYKMLQLCTLQYCEACMLLVTLLWYHNSTSLSVVLESSSG